MLSDVREAMLYQLGVDVSCEELNHFFTGKGKAALSGCAEWQQCFAVEKMLEFYYVHARDETLAMDTMKNSFKVAAGKMTRSDLAQEMVKELMISSAALAGGTFAQSFIGIPVVGFMIGSFIGSAIGSFAYNCGYSAVMSFCIDTGFTMFGLVKQDYTLPEDVLEYIGIDVFQYEKFLPKQFQKENFAPLNFNQRKFEADTIGIHILRRGVIGVSEIGYV